MNPRIALFFMMAMVFSPGMFHAAAAYLPSSFAMYTVMLGMAAFMNWRGGLKTAEGIFWFGVGGILGWPFAVALSVPFLLEELIFASISSKDAILDAARRFVRGTVASLLALVNTNLHWSAHASFTNADRHSNFSFRASSTNEWSLSH